MALRSALITACAVALNAGHAHAVTPTLDLGVVDEASFQTFRDAIAASEYVRYDFANAPNPRVVGVVAGLSVFAAQNPLADAAQLEAFAIAYNDALASFAVGDPNLHRSANMLAAFRFASVDDLPIFAGTNTDVGARVLEVLGIDLTTPENFESMRSRMVSYDRARIARFSERPEWSGLLVAGFAGRDLGGGANPAIAGVLRAYLESQGYEPEPDGVDDERFAHVVAGLASSLPADFASFQSLLAQPFESSTAWAGITAEIGEVRAVAEQNLSDLALAMQSEPTLVEGAANALDATIADHLFQDYRARVDMIVEPRVVIAANSMILLQSSDPAIRNLATQVRDFSGAQLETSNTIAGIGLGVEYVSSASSFILGAATGDPAGAISGFADFLLVNLDIVDTFGGVSPPSAEEQIFDEIIELRDQVEGVRVEMNQRFDRIEDQLDLLYTSVAGGFNALGDQIGALSADVEDIGRDIAVARASLDRIEDALWGVAQSLFLVDLTDIANDVLDARGSGGQDFPYSQGTPSFVGGATDLFSWGTTFSREPAFAGPLNSTLTVATALDQLDGQTIGRRVNDLRVFPLQLGLPALQPVRVPAPAPWTQSATAYAQLVEENRWYFAFLYQNQTDGAGVADIDMVIDAGEDLASAVEQGRNPQLFDALFDGYRDALEDVEDDIFTVVRQQVLADAGLPTDDAQGVSIDPWGGIDQDVHRFATDFPRLQGRFGLDPLTAFTGFGSINKWNLFGPGAVPELLSVLLPKSGPGAYSEEFLVSVDANGFLHDNDIRMVITYDTSNGSTRYRVERVLEWRLTSFGSPVQISSDSAVVSRFDNDPTFWINLYSWIASGDNTQGTTYNTFNGMGDQLTLEAVRDVVVEIPFAGSPRVEQELADLRDGIWDAAVASSAVQGFYDAVLAHETLIESYVTLSMPDLFENSTLARAAFRGNPTTGELSLSPPLQTVADNQTPGPFDPFEELRARAIIAQNDVNAALQDPAAGHSYLEFTLAELRDARENAFRLATDDTYETTGTLNISDPARSVLANDVRQENRVIVVDTGFGAAPSNGSVELHADGTFTYTPSQGFEGTDTFTYRALTTIDADPLSTANLVFSDPATVVIKVRGANGCVADYNNDGDVDLGDFGAFGLAFGTTDADANYDADSDFDNDGDVDLGDFGAFGMEFGRTDCLG